MLCLYTISSISKFFRMLCKIPFKSYDDINETYSKCIQVYPQDGLVRTDTAVGTPDYISPEVRTLSFRLQHRSGGGGPTPLGPPSLS